MDDSYVEDDYEMQRVARASDCDDAFFKYALSVNYDVKEVEGFFRDNIAIMEKPPKNSLLYELGVYDKVGYVKVAYTPNDQLLLCLNIAACYKCLKVFSYTNKEEVLAFVKAHKCQLQSDVAVNNSCEVAGSIDKNMSDFQDVNKSGSSICSAGLADDFKDVNKSGSSICSAGLANDFQDVNISSLSVCSARLADDFQDINKSGSSICSAGLADDFQDVNKSGSSICSAGLANDFQDVNISSLSVCSARLADDFQDVNKSSSSICSAGQADDIQNINKSSSSIFSTRQTDENESVFQNCERNNESVTASTEESMNTSSVVIDSTESENTEIDTTASSTDSSVHVTDSDIEECTAQNSASNKAMLDLYNKLDNSLESAVVSQLYNYNLTVTLNEFYKSNKFTDVTVVCENKKIKCHKLVLSMYSAHFEELLRDIHTDTSVILLQGLKFWQVKALIDYMYTGRIKNIEEGMWYLIEEAVDKLQFRDYLRPTELAVDIVNKSVHNTSHTNSQEEKKMRTYSRKQQHL